MAGWKLRKDKTLAETPDSEAPDAVEVPDSETVHAEAAIAEAPDTDFEATGPAQTYDLGELGTTQEPVSLDSLRHFPSDSEPEVHFTDLDFDSDPEDHGAASKIQYSEQGDGPLTLVDYTEPETAPEFILHGAQIFEMPPPVIVMPAPIEMPAATEMPRPAVEAPSAVIAPLPPVIEALPPVIEALPPVIEALPLILEAAPPVQTQEAAEEDFPERLRTGRFDRSEIAAPAPAPHFGIPAVSPFVLDTPVPAAPPATPQLVVRVGRLSAPFALAKDVTTIGRPDSGLHYYPDVEIEMDDAVSRRHAEVVKRGDSYFLVDTGSTNGTLLNGEKLPPQEERLLAYGDRIRVGDRTEITFE